MASASPEKGVNRDMWLQDKVAIITGAGSGIGRGAAVLFAREGARIVIVCRTPQKGHETVGLIEAEGGQACFIKADVSRESDVKQMVARAIELYGAPDILFNNAGVTVFKGLLDTTLEDWDYVLGVNLRGMFLCCKAVVPAMAEKGGGVILNTSSIQAIRASSDVAYVASKGGINALTRTLAVDLAPLNIRVNCICPGAVETPLLERGLRRGGTDQAYEAASEASLRGIPLGRFGSPADIAHAALCLVSDRASWITGATLCVDGGTIAML